MTKTGKVFPLNWDLEMPGPNWARRGIVGRGVLLDAEMWYLDALAADCEDDGVYEFLLTSAPLNKVGGIASPPNALAIK